MIGFDGQEAHEIAVAVGRRPSPLHDPERVNRINPFGRLDAHDPFPFQAGVAVNLFPGLLP